MENRAMFTSWTRWFTNACTSHFTFGSTDDLKEQLTHIQHIFPESDLYAVGSSAGTGLLVRYLGEQGLDTPFKAAFAMCPGYNTEIGFKMFIRFTQS
jgi:predicted alpha/beta-fold hydrolase